MENFKSIKDLKALYDSKNLGLDEDLEDLLLVLEETNPCGQTYTYKDGGLVISYRLKLNLFNFWGKLNLPVKTRVVGLPASICQKPYYGNIEAVKQIIGSMEGLSVILNADQDLELKGRTLSNFVFYRSFDSLEDYIDNLRSPYRRRVKKALLKRQGLSISKIKNESFSEDHYALYKSVIERTDNPLEILSLDFFKNSKTEIYEFLDKKDRRLLAFVQIKEFNNKVYFLFCGFRREDNPAYDLYLNMLLSVLELGLERKADLIDFGQTAEESKAKLGCCEEEKYLGIQHSNTIINYILQKLLVLFSYKPSKRGYKVFKEDKI